jgi:hypothetical protein
VERNTDSEGVNKLVQELVADCEAVARELLTRFRDMDVYLRLNVDSGNLLVNEWEDLGPVETETSVYVKRTEISETLEASLRRLRGTGAVTLGEISTYR